MSASTSPVSRYVTGPVNSGFGTFARPASTPDVGSSYASGNRVRSRRSAKDVRRMFPGVDRIFSGFAHRSSSVIVNPPRREKE